MSQTHPEPHGRPPTYAIIGIEVNSMAGSGIAVFADFGEAIEWLSDACEGCYDDTSQQREGRRRFEALLDRFKSDGYARDMGDELADIVSDAQSDKQGIPSYVVDSVAVLPDDLDGVLGDWWGDPDMDDYFADLAAEGEPIPEFDFANPEHMALLERRLELLKQV